MNQRSSPCTNTSGLGPVGGFHSRRSLYCVGYVRFRIDFWWSEYYFGIVFGFTYHSVRPRLRSNDLRAASWLELAYMNSLTRLRTKSQISGWKKALCKINITLSPDNIFPSDFFKTTSAWSENSISELFHDIPAAWRELSTINMLSLIRKIPTLAVNEAFY